MPIIVEDDEPIEIPVAQEPESEQRDPSEVLAKVVGLVMSAQAVATEQSIRSQMEEIATLLGDHKNLLDALVAAIEKKSKPKQWEFDVKRNHANMITKIVATPTK